MTENEVLEQVRQAGAEFAVRLYELAAQAERQPEATLTAKQASLAAGWSYDTFRREPAFDAAVRTPAGMRKRYDRKTVLRVAANLKQNQP